MQIILSSSHCGPITDLVSGVSWTADQLRLEIGKRVAFLNDRDIGKDDIVLICHGGTPSFFADLLALWELGACAACLNPALTANEIETVVKFVDPAAFLLGPGQGLKEVSAACPQFDLDTAARKAPPITATKTPALKAPALILFTSGTTGDPKGVVHTFASVQARLVHNRKFLDNNVLCRTLCVLPTYFGHGLIGNCLTPLMAGRHLLLFQNPGIKGAGALGNVIDDNVISFLSSVPSFWNVVLKVSPKPLGKSLQRISVGSAPLSAELWQAIVNWAGTDNVCNMYGITETANWVAGACARELTIENGLVGNMWGGEAAVLTAEGKRQASGQGEILLKPPSLMQGYFKRPDLTAEAIRGGWYHSGDVGVIDEQGAIRLLGRIKTEINKAGIKVLPEEVDVLLERHEDVLEACAFGIPDPVSGETVAAAVLLKAQAKADASELAQWCKQRIRSDCVPEKWYFVAEIPKTDRGKINRAVVRDYCLETSKND